MKAILVETQAVSRYFGGVKALERFDFVVEEGEIRGLIGPNGAGKTTFFNVVSGFLLATAGHIFLNRTEITSASVHARARMGIRRTFQNLQLFRKMTALQNVVIGLHGNTRCDVFDALLRTRRQRHEEAWMLEQAHETLKFVGLSSEAAVAASALPYGRMRLVEIARALVSKPKLLLLDEPAAGLNTTESLALVELIRRIQKTGVTVILVDHRMDVVMQTCGTITVLDYGKKLAEGPPTEIQTDARVVEAYLGRPDSFVRERLYA